MEDQLKYNFKSVCRNCNKASIGERPSMCMQLKCPEYTVCPMCEVNRDLFEHTSSSGDTVMICKTCIRRATNANSVMTDQVLKTLKKQNEEGQMPISTGNSGPTRDIEKMVAITPPGVAPPGLEPNEVEFYNRRWKEFEGYYRNPAAYFTVHMMILYEIYLTYLSANLIQWRGEMAVEAERRLSAAITIRKNLNDQLPEKESQDVQDDEKSMAFIYDTYVQEARKRTIGGNIKRIFTVDAEVLASQLHFPLEPAEILKRCGYGEADVERAIAAVDDIKDRTPEEILELFGFKLNEKFALPFTVEVNEEMDFGEVDDG